MREGTYRFISDVLDEIVSLFPSPYIHIGGDEVHYGNQSWFTDPEIQNFIKEKKLVDEKGLEHYFLRRAADIVASKGKTMIGWDEIIDAESRTGGRRSLSDRYEQQRNVCEGQD